MTKNTDDLFDDEVTTGATLDSGTTVGGNQVYHLGNDGQGSGLDVETVDGSEPVQKGQKYKSSQVYNNTGNAGSVLTKFHPNLSGGSYANPLGLGVDLEDSIWVGDTYDRFTKFNKSGTKLNSFASPSGGCNGAGVDTTGSIWITDYDSNSIYKVDTSGAVQTGFSAPSSYPEGLGVDLSNSIWTADRNALSIYQLDQTGNEASKFNTPSQFPKGIGVDTKDCIWHTGEGVSEYYQFDQSGAVTKTIPQQGQMGMDLDSSDTIWSADTNDDSIYYVDSGEKFLGTKLEKL